MKKDAFYFPHDSNASKDPKMTSLRVKTGLEGYGFFWLMVELLRESHDYKYPNNQAMLELALSLPQATLEPLLKTCLDVGLFVVEGGFITSKSLTERMCLIDRRREILRQAGRRGYEVKAGLSQAQATLKPPSSSKVKESKGKESKGEESKEETTTTKQLRFEKPTASLVTDYAKGISFHLDGQTFMDYYEANGWRVGRNPMKDWRAAVRTWKSRRTQDGQQRTHANSNHAVGEVERPDSKFSGVVKTVKV